MQSTGVKVKAIAEFMYMQMSYIYVARVYIGLPTSLINNARLSGCQII